MENMDAFRKDRKARHDFVEFTVESEAPLVGEFQYGPFHFMPVEIGDKPRGEARELCLRAQNYYSHHPIVRREVPIPDIAQEFTACATLFLRRRLRYQGLSRRNEKPVKLAVRPKFFDEAPVAPGEDLEAIAEPMEKLLQLPRAQYDHLLLSIRMYHSAVQILEEQPEVAYLLLVSAIGRLAAEMLALFEDLPGSEAMTRLLEQHVPDPEGREALKEAILRQQPKLAKSRFLAFVAGLVTEEFWQATECPDRFARVRPEELETYLDRIYDVVFEALHSALPFSSNTYLIKPEWEIYSPKIAMEAEGVSLPSLAWVERLANFVIRRYLDRLSKRG
jgi:hypothetical protein